MNLHKKVPRVAIVIPAFNEEEAISRVVNGISGYGTVIVVNDGSTDNTEQVALASGALVVSHDLNRGYDKALATGLLKALGEQFDFALLLTGMGSMLPNSLIFLFGAYWRCGYSNWLSR